MLRADPDCGTIAPVNSPAAPPERRVGIPGTPARPAATCETGGWRAGPDADHRPVAHPWRHNATGIDRQPQCPQRQPCRPTGRHGHADICARLSRAHLVIRARRSGALGKPGPRSRQQAPTTRRRRGRVIDPAVGDTASVGFGARLGMVCVVGEQLGGRWVRLRRRVFEALVASPRLLRRLPAIQGRIEVSTQKQRVRSRWP